MIKKVIASTVMIVLISASGTMVYANPGQLNYSNINVQEVSIAERPFQVVFPERNVTTTTNRHMIFTFTAPEGTTVTIDVYHNSGQGGEAEEFVQVGQSIEIKVGSLQRRTIEVEVQKGKNKIVFNAAKPSGTKREVVRIVNVKDIEEVKQDVKISINQRTTEMLNNITSKDKQ